MVYQLNFKQLIRIWDREHYESIFSVKHVSKPQDGLFACKALFSIEAFATNPKNQHKEYCSSSLSIFINQLLLVKKSIENNHNEKKAEWGDIHLVPFSATKHRMVLNIEKKYLCRSTGLMIKIFNAANNYLYDLHRAQHNVEISNDEYKELHDELITKLEKMLTTVCEKSQTFHIHRKKMQMEFTRQS